MNDTKTTIMTILAGAASGLMFALPEWSPVLGGILSAFTVLPLFFLALSHGIKPVMIASLLGLAVYAALIQNMQLATVYAVGYIVPTAFLSFLALCQKGGQHYSTGSLVVSASCYFLAAFGLYFGIMHVMGGENLLDQVEANMMTQMSITLEQNQAAFEAYPVESRAMMIEQWERAIKDIILLIPGFYIFSAIMMLFINLCIAHYVLKKNGKAIRPSYDFENMRLPHWMAIATVVATVLSWWVAKETILYFLAVNTAMILWLVMIIEGLALMHHWAASKGEDKKKQILTWAYVIIFMVFLPLIVLFFIALWDHAKRLTARA